MILCPRCKEHNESFMDNCLICGYKLRTSRVNYNSFIPNSSHTTSEPVFHEKDPKKEPKTARRKTAEEKKIPVTSQKQNAQKEGTSQSKIHCMKCQSPAITIISQQEMSDGTTFVMGQCKSCRKKGLFKLAP